MENVVFGQSVMGFNRIQVLEYIDRLVLQLKDQEDQYINQQEKLQQEVDNLYSKCAESKENLTLTVEKIKELSAEIEFFKQNNQELKEQVTHYRDLVLLKDNELFTLKKDFSQIKQQTDKVLEENEIWKLKQDKIGECLVEAAMKAELIIDKACVEAEAKKADLKENVKELTGDVNNLKDEISKVEQQLEASFKKLQLVIENMDSSAKTIEDQVTSYRDKLGQINDPKIENEKTSKAQEQSYQQKKSYTSSVKHGSVQYANTQKKNLTETVLDKISKLLDI